MITIANEAGKYLGLLNSIVLCPMCCCLIHMCRFVDGNGKSEKANMLCVSFAQLLIASFFFIQVLIINITNMDSGLTTGKIVAQTFCFFFVCFWSNILRKCVKDVREYNGYDSRVETSINRNERNPLLVSA